MYTQTHAYTHACTHTYIHRACMHMCVVNKTRSLPPSLTGKLSPESVFSSLPPLLPFCGGTRNALMAPSPTRRAPNDSGGIFFAPCADPRPAEITVDWDSYVLDGLSSHRT